MAELRCLLERMRNMRSPPGLAIDCYINCAPSNASASTI